MSDFKVVVTNTGCPYFTVGKTYECYYFSGGSALVKDDNGEDSVLWHNEYKVVEAPWLIDKGEE
nr:MAG TPA: hypothetical protein [Caudoviricetes sp.]